jgi:hypothetical protein
MMVTEHRQVKDQSSEGLTPIELADLYGFERSRITWSCPLPEVRELQSVPVGDSGVQ